MKEGKGKQKVTDQEILELFRQTDDPFATAAELAGQLPLTRQAINKRLNSLAEEGHVNRKACGSGVGWWLRD